MTWDPGTATPQEERQLMSDGTTHLKKKGKPRRRDLSESPTELPAPAPRSPSAGGEQQDHAALVSAAGLGQGAGRRAATAGGQPRRAVLLAQGTRGTTQRTIRTPRL